MDNIKKIQSLILKYLNDKYSELDVYGMNSAPHLLFYVKDGQAFCFYDTSDESLSINIWFFSFIFQMFRVEMFIKNKDSLMVWRTIGSWFKDNYGYTITDDINVFAPTDDMILTLERKLKK